LPGFWQQYGHDKTYYVEGEAVMDEHQIAYLCDGKACNMVDCYVFGGQCRHTFNPEHAKNGPFDESRFKCLSWHDLNGNGEVIKYEFWVEQEDENEPRD
jgi:hypothetical protein